MTSLNIFEAFNLIDLLQCIIVLFGLHVRRYWDIRRVLSSNNLAIQHSWLLTMTSLVGLLCRCARPLGWLTLAQVGSDVAAWCLMMCLWLLPLTLIHGLTQNSFKFDIPEHAYPVYQCFGVCILMLFVGLEAMKIVMDSRLLDGVMLIVFSMLALFCFGVSLATMQYYKQHSADSTLLCRLVAYHRVAAMVCVAVVPVVMWRITVLFHTHAQGQKLLVPDTSSTEHFVRLVLSCFMMAVLVVIYICSAPTSYQIRQLRPDLEAAQVVSKVRPPQTKRQRLTGHLCGHTNNRSRKSRSRPHKVLVPDVVQNTPATRSPYLLVPHTTLPRNTTNVPLLTTPQTAPVTRPTCNRKPLHT